MSVKSKVVYGIYWLVSRPVKALFWVIMLFTKGNW